MLLLKKMASGLPVKRSKCELTGSKENFRQKLRNSLNLPVEKAIESEEVLWNSNATILV